ncbi:MAG TPA: hypothetical protein VLM85_11525 [Polyangiaceae bacterium]|nr:hypothetical protein [Polyangiaceae bacterium]
MKTIDFVKLGLGACGVCWLVGCGAGGQYTVVSRTQPSAFARPGCHAIVEPVHAEHLMVGDKTEAQFLAEKRSNQVASFERDKRVSEETFVSQLQKRHGSVLAPGGASDNTFVIRPTWTAWDPGKFMGMFSKPGVGTFVVDVLSPTGQRLDRISIQPSKTSYTAADRMKGVFEDLGASVNLYIDENWSCAAH